MRTTAVAALTALVMLFPFVRPCDARPVHVHKASASSPLHHIIVVIQENRSVDDLFSGFCVNASTCANTVTVDPVSGTPLAAESLAAPFVPSDSHNNFVTEYRNGGSGWSNAKITCKPKQQTCPYTAFDYVPASETLIYRQLATVDGVLSDATLGTEQGPGLPAHLYAIAGQSGGYDTNHLAISGGNGSCESGSKKLVPTINMATGGSGPKIPPCLAMQTIFDLLASTAHTWRYYTDSATDYRAGPQAIAQLVNSPNFVIPSTKFLSDVASGNLADVSYVMPAPNSSDHPGLVRRAMAGPRWVASLVNAVGESKYWNDSAIVVFWDDWGGFFDHIQPPAAQGPPWMAQPDPFEYGFRVPLIVASPYAKIGTIDHTVRTFVSTLRLIEETFGLPQLGTTDQFEPDGLDSMFNFNQKPIPFTPLGK